MRQPDGSSFIGSEKSSVVPMMLLAAYAVSRGGSRSSASTERVAEVEPG